MTESQALFTQSQPPSITKLLPFIWDLKMNSSTTEVSKRFCEENLQLLFSVLFPKNGKGQLQGATQVGPKPHRNWKVWL